jgi:hypothetical protein
MVKRKASRRRLSTAAQTLGRRGGAARSAKQNAARQRNAANAGRPRRVCLFCECPIVAGHHDRRLDASCGAHGWKWQQGSTDQLSRGDLALYLAAELCRLQELLGSLTDPNTPMTSAEIHARATGTPTPTNPTTT